MKVSTISIGSGAEYSNEKKMYNTIVAASVGKLNEYPMISLFIIFCIIFPDLFLNLYLLYVCIKLTLMRFNHGVTTAIIKKLR